MFDARCGSFRHHQSQVRSHHVWIPLSGEYWINIGALPRQEVATPGCSQLVSDPVSSPRLSPDTTRFLEQPRALSGTGSCFYLLYYSQEERSGNDINRSAIAATRRSLQSFATTNKCH